MPRPSLLVAAVAVLALAGCGTTHGTPHPAPPPARMAAPTAVTIPAIGAASTLDPVGLAPDGTVQVPPVTKPMQAAWYQPGVRPGEVGPAVILGHVSGRPAGADHSIPGVFSRLAEVKPGDEVIVDRSDGTRAVFDITRVETYPKATFPTAAVWGDTAGPELRVVTCGGTFDPAARSYGSNVVAFAVPDGGTKP